MKVNGKDYRTVWLEGTECLMINQLLLPYKFEIIRLKNHYETAGAIKSMVVRGAGAIGVAAGCGMAQVIMEAGGKKGPERESYIQNGYERLRSTRPTAQNLFYALDRVMEAYNSSSDYESGVEAAVREARQIGDDDAEASRRIGLIGKELIKPGMRIMTHCNAGWLAFADWGTALSPIYAAHRDGIKVTVYASETRPRLQGANLTMWELMQEGIDVRLVPDGASGFLMREGLVDIVITGADRIAANGDTANKTGTYEKAVVAKENGIPFYIAAPTSTFDLDCPDGTHIPIERRSDDEVLYVSGMLEDGTIGRVRITPEGARAENPAFDVTPAKYISAIITEKGLLEPIVEGIRKVLG